MALFSHSHRAQNKIKSLSIKEIKRIPAICLNTNTFYPVHKIQNLNLEAPTFVLKCLPYQIPLIQHTFDSNWC